MTEFDQIEAPEQDPVPVLKDTDRKKLDGIVQQMVANKESDEAIQMVVNDFKQKYSTKPLPAFQPPTQRPASDMPRPLGQAENIIAAQQKAQGNKPLMTVMETAKQNIQKNVKNSDAAIASLLKKENQDARLEAAQLHAQRTGDIAPHRQLLPGQTNIARDISKEEIDMYKANMGENENLVRQVLKEQGKTDPTVTRDIYLIDAADRGAEKGAKITANAKKLAEGKLNYNPETGTLTKPQSAWESFGLGFSDRQKQLSDYEKLRNGNKAAVISDLENERNNFDPDEPVPENSLVNQFTNMVGMEGIAMLKGGAVAAIPGVGEVAAPFLAAAVNAPEYYKRGYTTGFVQAYNEARNQGLSENEAWDVAGKQAETEANLSAVEGVASTFIGARVGLKSFTPASTNIIKGVLKKAGKALPEALSDAAIAGGLQYGKNIAANAEGLERDVHEGVAENVGGELLFSAGVFAATKLGSEAMSQKNRKILLSALSKQPKKEVQAELGNLILENKISPEDAQETMQQIEERGALDQKIPEKIKNEEVRIRVQDKIQKREELEEQQKKLDKAFHPEIKEKIVNLDEEILDLSNSKEAKEEVEPVEDPEVVPRETTETPSANSDVQALVGKRIDEGKLSDVYRPMVENNPTELLSFIADQSFGRLSDGTVHPAEGNEPSLRQEFGDEIVDLAKARFPLVEVQVEEAAPSDASERIDFARRNNIKDYNKKFGSTNNIEDIRAEYSRNRIATLAKIGDHGTSNALEVDVNQYKQPVIALDKAAEFFKGDEMVERTIDFLRPIIEANPNIHIDTEAEFTDDALGYSYPDGRVTINFNKISDQDTMYRVMLHELVHASTRNEIANNRAFRDELSDVLVDVQKALGLEDKGALVPLLVSRGLIDADKYGAANEHELVAEIFSNQKFFDYLKGIEYKGDNLLKLIIEKILSFLSAEYRKVGEVKKGISANNMAEYIVALTEGTVGANQKQATPEGMALPMMTSSTGVQKDTIEQLIKKLKVSDEQLIQIIAKLTGLSNADAQELIDSVRKPPEPPVAPPITDVTPEGRNLAVKKFDNLFKEPEAKPKSDFWMRIKNASSWFDNPYRFITKITEDINREYGLKNNEVIPLGRVFEKQSAGRAALKVDAFVQDVVGRGKDALKGEKLDDFQKYMAARRVIDRLDHQAPEEDRQTGGITKQDAEIYLQVLEKKYGQEAIQDFERRGEAFQIHMDEMLHTLVGGGLLSLDAYKEIKAKNDFYAPFSVVQGKVFADQGKAPVGIAGVVKRIKGIDYTIDDATKLSTLNDLGRALADKKISTEEYFNTALAIIDGSLKKGTISQKEADALIANLENPGFALNGILDAAANMIYKAEGMAQRNTAMNRLFAYKKFDKDGLFIQDVEGLTPLTLPNGEIRMVPKPLNQIPVEEGMAPVRFKVDGKDKIVAINKYAAEKLNTINNAETNFWLKGVDFFNRAFRTTVITLSIPFQIKNAMIDFVRTAMLSRYGALAGKGFVEPVVNALLFVPQYMEALGHTTLGNMGYKTEAYKQWMESDSFSKGMFDNLFDNEKRIKSITETDAKRAINKLKSLEFIDAPGSAIEQSAKLLVHQRGAAVEGLEPKMFTAWLSTLAKNDIKPHMNQRQLQDAADRLNYEVQNMAGSPNFPQTHKGLKVASLFFQFLSARVKGEFTDYRRVANIFTTKGEGVKLGKQERAQMWLQFTSIAGIMIAYAVKNIVNDDDEKEYDSIPSYHQDNYLNIPSGSFEYTDANGKMQTYRDYIKVPLRGLTATMNVIAIRFAKFMKHKNPAEFKKMATNIIGNASPVNLQGRDEREIGESAVSNLTPVFKYFLEYSFNRDTHSHRDLVPEGFGRGMLDKYRKGLLKPWEVATNKTPEWAVKMSKMLYEEMGISISAIELDHMENTMGNPTELYNKTIDEMFKRSGIKYPVYESKEQQQSTSTPKTEYFN